MQRSLFHEVGSTTSMQPGGIWPKTLHLEHLPSQLKPDKHIFSPFDPLPYSMQLLFCYLLLFCLDKIFMAYTSYHVSN